MSEPTRPGAPRCTSAPRTAPSTDLTCVPFNSLVQAAAQLSTVGKSVFHDQRTTATALLCRLDTTLTRERRATADAVPASTPTLIPNNRIAITLIASASAARRKRGQRDEGDTLGNFDTFSVGAAVPLVASGSMDGVGNVEIVTASNGGGTGIPVSIWSQSDADIDKTGGGSAPASSTCQVGEFLKATPESQLLTTCATVNNACGCPRRQRCNQGNCLRQEPEHVVGTRPRASNAARTSTSWTLIVRRRRRQKPPATWARREPGHHVFPGPRHGQCL